MNEPDGSGKLSPRLKLSFILALCFILFFIGIAPLLGSGLQVRLPLWLFLAAATIPLQIGHIAACLIPIRLFPSERSWHERLDLKPISGAEVRLSVFGTAGLYILLAAVTGMTVLLLRKLGIEPQEQQLVTLLRQGSPAAVAVLLPATVLLAPFGEELCFRHVFFLVAEFHAGTVAAALATALFFAAMHGNLQVFPSLFLLSLWLTMLYRRTGSLLAPMLAHGVFNALTTMLLILLKAG